MWEMRGKKEEGKTDSGLGLRHPRRLSAADKWDAIVLITDIILLYLVHKQLL